jgi:heptosyltransferase-2
MQLQPIQLRPDAHILVVKLAGIGDLLLATPALQALRDTYPQARIDLLVTPDSAGLLNDWQVINEIIILDKYLFDAPKQILTRPERLKQLKQLYQQLRAGHYDAVLLLHHLTLPFGRLKHQALMRATGAKWRVGLDNGHGGFLNVRIQDDGFGAMHEAEYALEVAKAVGATATRKQVFIPLTEQERQIARQLVFGEAESNTKTPQTIRPIIALHPGSGGYSTARRWPPERFAQLMRQLLEDSKSQFLLMGGPEEAELHQQIIGMLPPNFPVRSLAGRGTIKVAAAVLELVDLFVGNDAGLMHLAVASGAPTVAIFGLTNYKAWGPYIGDAPNRRATIVHLDLPCMPCFYVGHQLGTPEGCATRDCLTQLGVDPVLMAARRMLRGTSQGSLPVRA